MIEKIVLFALSICLIWGWVLAYFIQKIENDDVKGWCYFNLLIVLIRLTIAAVGETALNAFFNNLALYPWFTIVYIVIQIILLIVNIKENDSFSDKGSRYYTESESVYKGMIFNGILTLFMGGFVAVCYYVVYGAIIAPLVQKIFS